jgi:hypothetical protein
MMLDAGRKPFEMMNFPPYLIIAVLDGFISLRMSLMGKVLDGFGA